MLFSISLFIAHLQAVLIPIYIGFKTIKMHKYFKNSFLIPWGFISLGLASMFEMLDHTQTEWIYIDHTSIFNWLFYSFLSLGLSLLSISVTKNKLLISFNLFTCSSAIISYLIFGKSIALIFQVIISILLISNWQRLFKDWLLIAYPIFGILLTTFFGVSLTLTSNQIWHIFIGPSGTISVITFFLVLIRFERKYNRVY